MGGCSETLHIGAQLLVHVPQTGRSGHTHPHTEAKAVSLPWAVVWILPEHDHLDIVYGAGQSPTEDIFRRREHSFFGAFF